MISCICRSVALRLCYVVSSFNQQDCWALFWSVKAEEQEDQWEQQDKVSRWLDQGQSHEKAQREGLKMQDKMKKIKMEADHSVPQTQKLVWLKRAKLDEREMACTTQNGRSGWSPSLANSVVPSKRSVLPPWSSGQCLRHFCWGQSGTVVWTEDWV